MVYFSEIYTTASYADPEDIHRHTVYLGAQCKRIFLRLDDKYHLAPAPRYTPTYRAAVERARGARTSSVPHSDDSGLDEDIKAQLQAAYGPDWRKYVA